MSDELAIPSRRYSTELAAEALRRAARLQAEAAERTARREPAQTATEAEGYSHQELVTAAREAGIDEELVSIALAEIDQSQALVPTRTVSDRAATRWLGTTQRSLLVSQQFEGSPAEIWLAIGEIFESDDCSLTLEPLTGAHPTEGGVACFRMKPLQQMISERAGAYTQLCYHMAALGVQRLSVRLRARGAHTQVTIHCDLQDSARRTVRRGRGFGGSMGVLTALGGVAITASMGALVAGLAGLAGLAVGVAMVMGLYRGSYRDSLSNLETQLEALLAQVGAHLRRSTIYPLPKGSDEAAST